MIITESIHNVRTSDKPLHGSRVYVYVLNNMIFRKQSVFVGFLWLAEQQIISRNINDQFL